MPDVAAKLATHADLEAVPPVLAAEFIFGVLEAHPRPSPWHGAAGANPGLALSAELGGPFQRGRGGPGGWEFLAEPDKVDHDKVDHLGLVDPRSRTLETLQRQVQIWLPTQPPSRASFDAAAPTAPRFASDPFSLGLLRPFDPPTPEPQS